MIMNDQTSPPLGYVIFSKATYPVYRPKANLDHEATNRDDFEISEYVVGNWQLDRNRRVYDTIEVAHEAVNAKMKFNGLNAEYEYRIHPIYL